MKYSSFLRAFIKSNKTIIFLEVEGPTLMKPLVANEKLEEFLKSFQDAILKRFEHKVQDRNTKIEDSESKLATLAKINNLDIKCDENKQ